MRKALSIPLLLFATMQTKPALVQTALVQAAVEQAKEQVETGQLNYSGKMLPYRIRRLPLAAFPDLPVPVLNALEQRQCMVPQTYAARRPENVIYGEFWQKGSRDWAVLCSHDGSTSLLVFRGNAIGLPVELASGKDTDRLQARLNGSLGFAWGLDPAAPENVRRVAGTKSGPFDHDGIQVSIVERSSEIHYYQNGTWLHFDGAE